LLKKLLEKTNSPINGDITIYSVFGSPKMNIGGLLQSGGVVADIWKKAIKTINNQQSFDFAQDRSTISNILILGLGCGTVARIFSKKWPKAKIVGVEIDPEVIKLGKKYFGLGEIPNLKIVCSDAIKIISNPSTSLRTGHQLTISNFDLIIVDLYLGEQIPRKSESLIFLKSLKKLLSENGIVIFNRLFWNGHKKKAKLFVKTTQKVFKQVKLVRTVANLLVFCQKYKR